MSFGTTTSWVPSYFVNYSTISKGVVMKLTRGQALLTAGEAAGSKQTRTTGSAIIISRHDDTTNKEMTISKGVDTHQGCSFPSVLPFIQLWWWFLHWLPAFQGCGIPEVTTVLEHTTINVQPSDPFTSKGVVPSARHYLGDPILLYEETSSISNSKQRATTEKNNINHSALWLLSGPQNHCNSRVCWLCS